MKSAKNLVDLYTHHKTVIIYSIILYILSILLVIFLVGAICTLAVYSTRIPRVITLAVLLQAFGFRALTLVCEFTRFYILLLLCVLYLLNIGFCVAAVHTSTILTTHLALRIALAVRLKA